MSFNSPSKRVRVAAGKIAWVSGPCNGHSPGRRHDHVFVEQDQFKVREELPNATDVLLDVLVGRDEGREAVTKQRVHLVVWP